jgi:hypothetical protein
MFSIGNFYFLCKKKMNIQYSAVFIFIILNMVHSASYSMDLLKEADHNISPHILSFLSDQERARVRPVGKAFNNHIECMNIRFLKQFSQDQKNAFLYEAICSNCVPKTREVLAAGAHIDRTNNQHNISQQTLPIIIPIRHPEIDKLLIEHGMPSGQIGHHDRIHLMKLNKNGNISDIDVYRAYSLSTKHFRTNKPSARFTFLSKPFIHIKNILSKQQFLITVMTILIFEYYFLQ